MDHAELNAAWRECGPRRYGFLKMKQGPFSPLRERLTLYRRFRRSKTFFFKEEQPKETHPKYCHPQHGWPKQLCF
jgi:hypothetical protein